MGTADVEGRVFVVTGAAGGIGRGLCAELLRRRAHVVASDIAWSRLQEQALQDGWDPRLALLLDQDVRDPGRWEQVLDEAEVRFGPVDVLVNNAGVARPAWLVDTSVADVVDHLDVNARGMILGTRAAARRMVARGRGHVINIASLCAIAPTPGLALYSASKFAVRGFSLAVAGELRRHGVAVTVVCPDAVDTPMTTLELGFPEASLVFSGGHVLTVAELCEVLLDRVLRDRPLEVDLPLHRGWLSHLAGLLPRLARHLVPLVFERADRKRRNLLEERRDEAA